MGDLLVQIERLLNSEGEPLSTAEIAERLDVSAREVGQAIWGDPQRFIWQPGHRWALITRKAAPRIGEGEPDHEDSREAALLGHDPAELRAVTLATGVVLRVSRRALDTPALFNVRSQGNEIHLVLNSAHELFAVLPMPFSDGSGTDGYEALLELLLEAWALYEDSLPPGSAKRELQDARVMWGRRALELLTESE